MWFFFWNIRCVILEYGKYKLRILFSSVENVKRIWGFWCNLRSSSMAGHDLCSLSQCDIMFTIEWNGEIRSTPIRDKVEEGNGGKLFESNCGLIFGIRWKKEMEGSISNRIVAWYCSWVFIPLRASIGHEEPWICPRLYSVSEFENDNEFTIQEPAIDLSNILIQFEGSWYKPYHLFKFMEAIKVRHLSLILWCLNDWRSILVLWNI